MKTRPIPAHAAPTLIAGITLLSASLAHAEEFSTSAAWTVGNTHGWTLTIPTGSTAKVCGAGEDQILTATPGSGDMSHSGEIRFDVSPGDDKTLSVDKAPRVLKAVMDNNADWTIETAIMQPDPNNTDIFKQSAPYHGAFYPKRAGGVEATNVHSHAGLVLWKGSDWLLFGQLNNTSMGVAGFVGGSAVNVTLTYPDTDSTKHLFQYFRIRKRTRPLLPTRYYLECSGGVKLDETTYPAPPDPGAHPGGRYGWISLGYFDDTNAAFNNGSYGLMAKNPSGAGYAGYRVQFSYFYENIPVNELDDFTSTTITATSAPSPWVYNTRTGTSTIAVIIAAATGYTPATSGVNKLGFTIKKADTFATGNGYKAPTLLKAEKFSDWIIDTQVKDRVASGNQTVYGLIVYHDDSNWIHFGQWSSSGQLRASGTLGGTYTSQLSGVPVLTGLHDYLRIEKSGSTYTFRYSDDAVTWTKLGAWSDGGNNLSTRQYGFMAASTNITQANTDFTPSFEFFREFAQPSGTIKSVQNATQIVRLVGAAGSSYDPPQNNPDAAHWNLNGADLGSLAESASTVYMMFGDNQAADGTHRPNYLAHTPITSDFTTGFPFAGTYTAPAINLGGTRTDFLEATRIPTSGIVPSQNIFYMFQNVYHWGVAASHWESNWSEWAYSTNGGVSFSPLEGANNPRWGANSNFIQTAIARDPTSNPTYVYMFGTPAGGYGSVKLARVPITNMVDVNYYSYYKGGDGSLASAWSTVESDAVTVIPAPVREFSIQYCAQLGRWLLLAQNDNMRDIEVRDAPKPWGPWSAGVTAVDHNSPLAFYQTDATHYGQSYFYGGFMTPAYMTGNSSAATIYFALSKFKPYSVWWDKITLSTSAAP